MLRETLSYVPPFIKDDFLVNMLSCYGKLDSCVVFLRIPFYAYMVLKDNAELDVSFNF